MLCEPLVGTVPDHEFEAMQDVVLSEVQMTFPLVPAGMLAGLKVNVICGSAITVSVADAVAVPSGPVHVNV